MDREPACSSARMPVSLVRAMTLQRPEGDPVASFPLWEAAGKAVPVL